ncbi:hypothetical protein CW751_11040 [Brumimicrobium salinarum]|uniref:Lipid/polyisoprenoid-binding YceI-like domain-containing protein n=1 Tax=Brumimicrobium salinarum TaxID=2058658 RepID=A0A2I0R1B7_9FLAO|nr:YceI family protein [Brumimicrobium salinarum]PKR80190.1 hypothetical protein CW751_11040 [Brumimicrobium salinarum]
MKKLIYGVFAFAAMGLTACGANDQEEVTNETKTEDTKEEVVAETYNLNSEESVLNWEGSWTGGKNDGKTHYGIVSISEGSVTKEGDNYKGSFTVDMNTIEVQDIDEASGKPKLEKHLNSEDFFNTSEYGTVNVTLNEIVDNKASITIDYHGVEMNETFPVEVNTSGDNMSISGEFGVDFEKANMSGMQVNPEKPEDGKVSSMINFELEAELSK